MQRLNEEQTQEKCSTQKVVFSLIENENIRQVTDRSYWTKQGSEATVKIADEIIAVIKNFSSDYEWKYNKL